VNLQNLSLGVARVTRGKNPFAVHLESSVAMWKGAANQIQTESKITVE
jgi:hypothetical protein